MVTRASTTLFRSIHRLQMLPHVRFRHLALNSYDWDSPLVLWWGPYFFCQGSHEHRIATGVLKNQGKLWGGRPSLAAIPPTSHKVERLLPMHWDVQCKPKGSSIEGELQHNVFHFLCPPAHIKCCTSKSNPMHFSRATPEEPLLNF